MKRLLVCTGLLGLFGCPQTVRPLLEDGGPTHGSDAGENSDATTSSDGAASDAGEIDGGGLDAGLPDSGTPNSYRWSRLSLPADTRTIVAIWGRGPDEVFVGTSNGHVLLFDGAAWSDVWRVPNNFGVTAIDGTSTKVFVAGQRNLYVHRDVPAANPDVYEAGNSIGGLSVVNDNLAFLVSERTNSRGLFHFDGNAVTEVVPNLPLASINGVWAEPGPKVWIAGNGRFITYDGLGSQDEPVEWPGTWSGSDIANFFIYDIQRVGQTRLAVGTGGGVMTDEDGTWRFERDAEGSEDFEAVAAVGGGAEPSAIAVGEPVDGAPIHWRTSAGWQADPMRESLRLVAVWVAGPNEIFVGGGQRNTFDGVLLRGTR